MPAANIADLRAARLLHESHLAKSRGLYDLFIVQPPIQVPQIGKDDPPGHPRRRR